MVQKTSRQASLDTLFRSALKTDQFPTGISDQFAPESAISLVRNQ